MELTPEQEFTYLPNTSFRGPDHVHVRWDPALNPELRDRAILDRHVDFPFGAPRNTAAVHDMRVVEVHREAEDVVRLVLEAEGRPLPAWSPGAHVDLIVGDYVRNYSLCRESATRRRIEIAILRESNGRGGSAFIHSTVVPGTLVQVRGPKNHFRLDENAEHYLLIAGGIGITPIIAMADRLKVLGKDYQLHYAGRALERMAFVERLRRDHGKRLHLYPADQRRRLALAEVVAGAPADAEIYACGPDRLLTELAERAADRPDRLHVEYFAAGGAASDDRPFDVELSDSGFSLHVPAERSLMDVLRGAGIDIQSDCEEGLCGTCMVEVIEGEVDHRDKVLAASERAENSRMTACCSRAANGRLKIAL